MKSNFFENEDLYELSLNEELTIEGGKYVWDSDKSFFYNAGAAIGYVIGQFTHDIAEPFYNINAPCY